MKPGWLTDWPTAWPRPEGEWTVGAAGEAGETDGTARWGVLEPETGQVQVVDPAADPELPGLAQVIGRGRLVGYRARRRAVVSTGSGWIKVLRPKRLGAALASYEQVEGLGLTSVEVPKVTGSDPSGWFELTTVPGCSLHELIAGGSNQLEMAIETTAAALRALHDASVPVGELPRHSPDDPNRWVEIVARALPSQVDALAPIAAGLRAHPTVGDRVIHSDLHDKNVLIAGGRPGLIDVDGLKVGSPEVDVANLAVHLELRAMQQGIDPGIGAAWSDHLVASYGRELLDPDSMAAIRDHTWFRLSCLYRFRHSGHHLAPAMLRLCVL